jgi:hypothetical protein
MTVSRHAPNESFSGCLARIRTWTSSLCLGKPVSQNTFLGTSQNKAADSHCCLALFADVSRVRFTGKGGGGDCTVRSLPSAPLIRLQTEEKYEKGRDR